MRSQPNPGTAAVALCRSPPPLCALVGAALERNLHSPAASPPQAAEASAQLGPGFGTQLPGSVVGGDSAPQPPGNMSSGMYVESRGDLGRTRRLLTALPGAACSPPRRSRTVAEAVPGRASSSAPRPHVPRGGAACGERRREHGKSGGISTGTSAASPPTAARSDPAPRNTAQRDWCVPSGTLRQSRSALFLEGARCRLGGVVRGL